MSSTSEPSGPTLWPPAFDSTVWPVVAFGVAYAVWAMVSNALFTWLVGPDSATVLESLWNIPSGIVQVSIAVVVLRYEGVRFRDIGLARKLVVPALVAAVGFAVLVNAFVVGAVGLRGGSFSVGLFAYLQSPPQNYSLAAVSAGVVAQYVFVGPVEELAFRGYLQNKLIALFGEIDVRVRTALGILATGVVFALIHIPTLVLIRGLGVGAAAGSLALLAASGMTIGAVYALTRNLYLAMFLHGVGNFWPLVIDYPVGVWPNYLVIFVLYVLVVVAYRQWAARTSRPIQQPRLVGAD